MAEKVHPINPSTTGSLAIQMPHQKNINKEQERSLLPADHHAHKQKDFIYKMPLPLPPNHPSYRRRRRSPCCCCLAWVCSILAIIIILLGVGVLVLYLVLQPKAPQFSVTDATIAAFNLTTQPTPASNATSVNLTADVTFAVQAENPNRKIGIYYDDVGVTLFYEGAQIGEGSIPAFYQGHRNTTLLDLQMKGQDVALTSAIGSALQTSLSNDSSSIWLEAKTIAQVRIKVGSWKSRDSKFQVDCDVQISNPAVGNARLLSKKCSFKVKSFSL